MRLRGEDEQTRALQELCSMTIDLLRSPPLRTISFPRLSNMACGSSSRQPPQISPAAFGMLFVGISVALMLLGVVTLIVGIILLPLVLNLIFSFYFFGILSNLFKFSSTLFSPPAPISYNFVSVWSRH